MYNLCIEDGKYARCVEDVIILHFLILLIDYKSLECVETMHYSA